MQCIALCRMKMYASGPDLQLRILKQLLHFQVCGAVAANQGIGADVRFPQEPCANSERCKPIAQVQQFWQVSSANLGAWERNAHRPSSCRSTRYRSGRT